MSNWYVRAGLWLAIHSVPAATVMAAEEGHAVSPAQPFVSLVTLLIFMLVIVVLGKFAWKPLLAGLQKREDFIRESLASAKRDREEAQARLREYQQAIQKAREEASALVEEGRRDAEATRRRIEEEAQKRADEMIERARREIAVARDTALRDLYDQAAEMAMTVAGAVLRKQISPQDHEQLVRDVLGELRNQPQGARANGKLSSGRL